MELQKYFDFKDAQRRWNEAWDRAGVFTADVESDREPFVIILPPPNVTGILHVGHVLGDSVQDFFIRWKRMLGCNTLFVPGSDHAGIATQKVVENDLASRGVRRRELSREEFLEHAWAWKETHHERIVTQLKNLGCALDWSREAFTLDPERSRAVREVFVRLYDKSLIYRGNYIVNWCPSCRTAISDEEVEYKEKDSHLYWIRYALGGGGSLVVATTRPETMLGDTAVAVHPGDGARGKLVGKTAALPLVGRELPVIADEAVDPEFGSGFVKVTPAHDPNDFEMGQRHGLPHVVVIDRGGKMTQAAGEAFAGLDRFECRKAVLEELERQGALVKAEPYRHAVGEHDRCHTVIEPLLSREWFVKMQPLAGPAVEVVEKGEIDFYPPRWRNVYLSWMNNIRDWCISRQLWWGHRIPVWYCPGGHLTVAVDDPAECATCGSGDLTQDEDVLDTWFSSWLWTFSPLGWPAKTRDLEVFHPTSVLVTGSEIIFFWVARMIMASLEFMKEIPFRQVFLTGIVRDTQGRKMSKSLGNSPDPLDIIEKYGTDAFRFTLVMLSPPGRDVFFAEEKLEMGRNFINKIWQASRMILSAHARDGARLLGGDVAATGRFAELWAERYRQPLAFEPELGWEDRWILSALDGAARDVDESLRAWRLNDAAARVYEFFWSEFCDWYLELAKIRLYGEGDKRTTIAVLLFALAESLKMLHPVVPYVTEELWAGLPMTGGLVLENAYPVALAGAGSREVEERMVLFKGLVTATRNIRALYGVKPATAIELRVKTPPGAEASLDDMAPGLKQLTRADRLDYGPQVRKEKGTASSPVGGFEVIVPLSGVTDIGAELERLRKERKKLERDLSMLDKKLSNKDFVAKAREDVVGRARDRKRVLETELSKIKESLDIISSQT
ncbi:MAG: valine--tRNA ligase [Candidatus Krumholzibacteriia bacterium]